VGQGKDSGKWRDTLGHRIQGHRVLERSGKKKDERHTPCTKSSALFLKGEAAQGWSKRKKNEGGGEPKNK